ncbi:MAG: hypothetical protein LUH22_16680 [Bacteroides sp.]|nr:hypothetical protein [Bacteroides sp.]
MKHVLLPLYITFLFMVVLLPVTAQNRITSIEEFYFFVNEKGEIDKEKVTEKRKLVYHKELGYHPVNTGKKKNSQESQADAYYKLPEIEHQKVGCLYDDNQKVIEYTEQIDDHQQIRHVYTYNDRGDLLEDRSTMIENNISSQESVLTYEYFYLDDFEYATKKGKKYIAGMKRNSATSWVLRTIKKDGVVVQFTERKIKNTK